MMLIVPTLCLHLSSKLQYAANSIAAVMKSTNEYKWEENASYADVPMTLKTWRGYIQGSNEGS